MTGQGFKLDTAEKLAIERHAIAVVSKYFREQDFKVRDVGSFKPFDLNIKRGDEHLSVEVKGTTSQGAQVILTNGEVNHHRTRYPDKALAIVHSIHLDRAVDPPVASGGQLHITSPWIIEDKDLRTISCKYSTGL